jgi:putative hemolysin
MARRDSLSPPRNLFERFRPAPAVPNLISALQAYGGLQAWAARAHRPTQSLGRLGSLEVRLAQTAAEVRQAQKLRYRVFYQEGPAIANPGRLFARRDVDAYDAICDHLLVLDHAARDGQNANRPAVVGTYRLLRQPMAEEYGGFYSTAEFDIGGLLARHGDLQFLELGRSCVLAPYRNKRTVELLWHGIAGYLRQNRTDVMFGCASLDGTDPRQLAVPLSFLHHYARGAGSLARAGAARALCRDDPDIEGSDRSKASAARAAAADQGLSAVRGLYRRRGGGRPRVRHHRRADRVAGVGDQEALHRALRREPAGGVAHNLRSDTSSTWWLSTFFRMRSERWRVGRIFSCRFIRLMRSQIDDAVSVASASDRFE